MYYTVYGIWCHMRDGVTYSILRRMLGYTNDQKLRHAHQNAKLSTSSTPMCYTRRHIVNDFSL